MAGAQDFGASALGMRLRPGGSRSGLFLLRRSSCRDWAPLCCLRALPRAAARRWSGRLHRVVVVLGGRGLLRLVTQPGRLRLQRSPRFPGRGFRPPPLLRGPPCPGVCSLMVSMPSGVLSTVPRIGLGLLVSSASAPRAGRNNSLAGVFGLAYSATPAWFCLMPLAHKTVQQRPLRLDHHTKASLGASPRAILGIGRQVNSDKLFDSPTHSMGRAMTYQGNPSCSTHLKLLRRCA